MRKKTVNQNVSTDVNESKPRVLNSKKNACQEKLQFICAVPIPKDDHFIHVLQLLIG
jgi:hypothetical protein